MTWGDVKMPRHTRTSRFVATMAVGVVAALPLLAAGPAFAAPPRIEFSGPGAGLLSCGSRPSDRDLTVPAESTVIFVNKLRDDATLRINGREAAPVPQGGSTEVLFHRGPVRVDMVPDCGLSLATDIEAVSVTVVAPGSSASGPSSSGPARSGKSPAGASAQSSRASRPAGAYRSASPGGSVSASAGGVAAAGGGISPAPGAGEGSAAGDSEGVAEPVSTAAASSKDGPNGLLTIIAVVCIVGVSAGAIRAIAAQRATRTSVA
jgi:hypothetical protein